MKKIGIITFHCSYNYGSMLQAYAMQKYLINKNYNVEIIDYILRCNFEEYKIFKFRYYKKNKRTILSDVRHIFKNLRRKVNFEKFSNKYLIKTNKKYYDFDSMEELNKDFDAFICGSDQIWNFACTEGIIPAYFLDFVHDDKLKIAYAPSIAHLNFDEIDRAELGKLINRLDYISVREESTIPLIKDIVNKNIENVLDPTLLLDSEEYNDIIEEHKIKGKFIFLYMLEENSKIYDYANKLSEKYDIQIIYIRKKKVKELKNAKDVYGISPCHFLFFIKNAEYIITNSFHATVFSILFEKKFVTFKTEKSYSRMTDLLNKINLQDRIYRDNFNINKDINYNLSKMKLYELKKHSEEYLKKALASS